MTIDATTRHAFAYGGTALQMADEHTMVLVAGNALQFVSTVTNSQHFLMRNKTRKLLVFDINWRTAEIALTSRDPNPEILLYSYPDKKLRGKLENGATMEYSRLKYSRCGRRMVTLRVDDQHTPRGAAQEDDVKATVTAGGTRGREEGVCNDPTKVTQRLCVWDVEAREPLKGCASATVSMDVSFLSFDPSNSDHFLLGGADGLQLWKIYRGKASYTMRNVSVKLRSWVGATGSLQQQQQQQQPSDPQDDEALGLLQDLLEKRHAFLAHAWMRNGRVLITNRAGELVMVDTTATSSGNELTGTIIESATQPDRCCIAGVVYTSESIVLVYADGSVSWLQEKTFEVLQTTVLPCYMNAPPPSSTISGSGRAGASTNGMLAQSARVGSGVIATVAPSPNHSKVYVGTHDGNVYELKVNAALDDEEEMEEDSLGKRARVVEGDDPASVAARMISSCGSFHAGAVLASALLTPCGGTFAQDLVIASGGTSGCIYLWHATKCRIMASTNLSKLFSLDAHALAGDGENTTTAATGRDGDSLNAMTQAGSLSNTTTLTGPAAGVAASSVFDKPSIVITALVARPGDPLLLVGDRCGKLRALCVSKVVGGSGALEFIPLRVMRLFKNAALDLLDIHPTQSMVLAASTRDRHIFVLSMDHEREFKVMAYVSLPAVTLSAHIPATGSSGEKDDDLASGQPEHILDVKWSAPPHNPNVLCFTFYTTHGRLLLTRYQEPAASGAVKTSGHGDGDGASLAVGSEIAGVAEPSLAVELKSSVLAHGKELVSKCGSFRFLLDAPMNVLLASSPTCSDLHLIKYADLVTDPSERVGLQSKALTTGAHDAGISAVALYPYRLRNNEQLIATAGMNGVLALWMISFSGESALNPTELLFEDVQIAKKKTLVPHMGAVTSLAFVHVNADEIYLISTGTDSCVYLLEIRISSDMLRAEPLEPTLSPLYLNIANYAKYEKPFKPEDEMIPHPRAFLDVLREEQERMARNRFDRLKDKTRAELSDLEKKLTFLLAENDRAPESDRLQRDEFVINTAWRDAVLLQNQKRADGVRTEIMRDIGRMSIVRERMKIEFWDSAAVHGAKLRGLTPAVGASSAAAAAVSDGTQSIATVGAAAVTPALPLAAQISPLFVYNFPMRRLTKDEELRMKRIELLRLIEYEHLQQETTVMPSNGPRVRIPASEETALSRFQDTVGANLQWLINAGGLHPCLNLGIKIPASTSTTTGNAPSKDKDSSEAGASAVSSPPTGSTAPDAVAAALASCCSSLIMPVSVTSLNDVQGFHLVYHPAVIRTRKQQRIQIQLLKSYVRYLLLEYNRAFQALVKLKETKMDEIETKNARIEEITKELAAGAEAGPDATAGELLFRPIWAPDEIATSILEVAPAEMTQTPYESEATRLKREQEAAERAALERERQKDDVAGRALRDMMDGTLEAKKENLVSQTLVKEQWMVDTPADEMTAEQKKMVAQFEAAQQKLKDEQDKYKKSLDLELKKIRVEIQEVCKAFDDRVRSMQDAYVNVRTSVLAQQLYELRLAEDLMEHEHLRSEQSRITTEMAELRHDIRVCEKENELFAMEVEARKDEWQRSAEEDKALEKSFVRDLDDQMNTVGVALEHDLIKNLVELYKKRKGEDIRQGADGSGGGTGGHPRMMNKKRKSGSNLMAGSKQRLLAEASDNMGATSTATTAGARSLAAVSVLQSLQLAASGDGDGLESENIYDPFAGIDVSSLSLSSAMTKLEIRHVVPLDYEMDRPDGLMIDDRVWRTLNELRSRKIIMEHAVKEKAEKFAHARAVADELHIKLQELQDDYEDRTRELERATQQLEALSYNATLLVHVKQGQDETIALGDDVSRIETRGSGNEGRAKDALMVARSSVESLNDVIQMHGKDQVNILSKIKNFRKNINVMEWEHTLLEMQTRDMEERYTDIQLLRVTKDLQELFHTGDATEKQKRELALLDAKLNHLGKSHQGNLIKLDKVHAKLSKQLRDRERENDGFQAQVQQLEMQVQIREDILASRKSAALRKAATTSAPDDREGARMKAITVRRKLVDLARAQTEEIDYLRMELDRMRRRTFPSFAQQHAEREYHSADSNL